MNLLSEIASVYREQVKTKAKTALSFATRHNGVWASGSKLPRIFILSTTVIHAPATSLRWPLDTRPVWALRRILKIFSLYRI